MRKVWYCEEHDRLGNRMACGSRVKVGACPMVRMFLVSDLDAKLSGLIGVTPDVPVDSNTPSAAVIPSESAPIPEFIWTKDEIRKATKVLWESAPEDDALRDALLIVLPVVDKWLERI